MPESPRWLMKNGEPEKALEILARLRTEDGVVNDVVQREFNEIEQALQLTSTGEGKDGYSYFAMVFKPCGKLHLSRRVSRLFPLLFHDQPDRFFSSNSDTIGNPAANSPRMDGNRSNHSLPTHHLQHGYVFVVLPSSSPSHSLFDCLRFRVLPSRI